MSDITRALADVCRWLGRLLGAAALLVVLAFVVGEGVGVGALRPRDVALFVLLALGLAGHLVAWRWEAAGAAVALLALLGLVALELAARHRLPGPWFFALLGVPALCFLMGAIRRLADQS